MPTINPHTIYTAPELAEIIGRATLESLRRAGLRAVADRYLGHSPKGVTERHYMTRLGAVSRGQEEALQGAMDLFRLHVVSHIDKAVDAQKQNTERINHEQN